MIDVQAQDVTGRTRVLAVFGYPVEHSLSPLMHNAAIAALGLDYIYVPLCVDLGGLADAIAGVRAMRFAGVNLTIPLKEAAVSLVDGLSDNAARIGSVNTLWWKDGQLMGESTDGEGFIRSLEGEAGSVPGRALVLGAGGSSRAVCYALADRHVELTIANRTVERAERLATEIAGVRASAVALEPDALRRAAADVELIVNCTSIGMTPDIGGSPLSSDCIGPQHIVCDLVYNPRQTELLRMARERGARTINGLKMLVHQGARSFELWTGKTPPVEVMEEVISQHL